MGKYHRIPGIVTCKFDREVDLEKAQEFIKTWIGYAIVIARSRIEKFKCYDRDIVKSSAMEGLMDAFCSLVKKHPDESWSEALKKNSSQFR